MVRLNKIYTKTGDDGTTALGNGERRLKYDPRVEAYGTVDEANACVGMARTFAADGDVELGVRRWGWAPFLFGAAGTGRGITKRGGAFDNRLRRAIASTTDLPNSLYAVEITGDQQQALRHH